MVGLGVFSLGPPKSVLSKIDRKLEGAIGHLIWTKMPTYNCNFTCFAFLHTFFFLTEQALLPAFFFSLNNACLPFFFFWFTGLVFFSISFFLSFVFFFFCLDVIFLWTWFLFFNKFRWLIFFGCLSLFWVLIRHYFLIRLYA